MDIQIFCAADLHAAYFGILFAGDLCDRNVDDDLETAVRKDSCLNHRFCIYDAFCRHVNVVVYIYDRQDAASIMGNGSLRLGPCDGHAGIAVRRDGFQRYASCGRIDVRIALRCVVCKDPQGTGIQGCVVFQFNSCLEVSVRPGVTDHNAGRYSPEIGIGCQDIAAAGSERKNIHFSGDRSVLHRIDCIVFCPGIGDAYVYGPGDGSACSGNDIRLCRIFSALVQITEYKNRSALKNV